MTKKAIIMHPDDNVATVLEKIAKGEELVIEKGPNDTETITTLTKIKFLHKVAIRDIPEGTAIKKYGQIIGRATHDIQKGTHVHTKNVKSWFYS
ncbi:MAG: UxaA family hydrolase [Candidatus Helarchaeota archaeon]|nr:UxaA family hydrolase [Candidatus Helarchaeota archaeon]